MIFKINQYNKVKSSHMLDPQLLTEAKILAVNKHLTLGNIIEEALQQYLEKAKTEAVAAAQEQEKVKQQEKEAEAAEVERFSESGRGLPPSFIFRHYEEDKG